MSALKVQHPPSNTILRAASTLPSESKLIPGLLHPSHHNNPPLEGMSTAGGSGDGDRKRCGVDECVFVLTFVSFVESTEL